LGGGEGGTWRILPPTANIENRGIGKKGPASRTLDKNTGFISKEGRTSKNGPRRARGGKTIWREGKLNMPKGGIQSEKSRQTP